jgi:iron(III) transport system ATP-binding protein
MSAVRISGLLKSLGGRAVLHGIDLAVPAGAIVALLGPSGCGKTTLLRLIAGFDFADAGEIAIDERVVEATGIHVPPERRRIGYVPQEGTLFPHLTVAGNIGFGLGRAERRNGRIAEVLHLTGLDGLELRHPHQLSGGQQQRTALARALAPRPDVILLDEPFNALDMDLRRTVCQEVIATLCASATTAILVTHDPQEAFASADLVAVMHAGRIAQYGDPTSIYRAPGDPRVARLTGPAIFLDGRIEGMIAHTILGPIALRSALRDDAISGTVFLRPEQIVPASPGEGVPARIEKRLFHGDHFLATIRIGDIALRVRFTEASVPSVNETIRLRVDGPALAFPGKPDA